MAGAGSGGIAAGTSRLVIVYVFFFSGDAFMGVRYANLDQVTRVSWAQGQFLGLKEPVVPLLLSSDYL